MDGHSALRTLGRPHALAAAGLDALSTVDMAAWKDHLWISKSGEADGAHELLSQRLDLALEDGACLLQGVVHEAV